MRQSRGKYEQRIIARLRSVGPDSYIKDGYVRLFLLADLNKAPTGRRRETSGSEIRVSKISKPLAVEGILDIFECERIVHEACFRCWNEH